MPEDDTPKIKKGEREFVGATFRLANSGDPWDCLRYTGTLITELATVAETVNDVTLARKCGACTRMWEQAVQIFEASKDDHGNPNWGQSMIICNRILKMLGKSATKDYGDIPSDSGKYIGSQAAKSS